jgi:bacterioferritin-associated ferredoxin
MSDENKKISVRLQGRDHIDVNLEGAFPKVSFRGCSEMMDLMQLMRKNFGIDLRQWPIPPGTSHSEILLRELILKLRGNWQYPTPEVEVCHCRSVACYTIDQAIIAGAHSTEIVSRQTSASTACGTCRSQVQKMIDYRLNEGRVAMTAPTPAKKSA